MHASVNTRGRDVAVLVTKGVHAFQACRQLAVVFHKFREHVPGGDVLAVVIGDALKAGYVPDRT